MTIRFKDRLRSLRTERGWTQEELSQRLNSTKSAVANWETGTRVPKADKLEEIADLFNVDLGYLLGKTDKTTRLTRMYSSEESDAASDFFRAWYRNPNVRDLVIESVGATKEDIDVLIEVLKRMKR